MKHKCNCYHKENKKIYTYHPATGLPIEHNVDVGICWGTKEMDECDCGGNKIKCDFYPEVREEAKRDATIQEAINHYNYGISHDIFKEPVTSYAKIAVEAMGKQIPQKVIKEAYFYGYLHRCPSCKSDFLDNPYGVKFKYCGECGQALDWDN